ncbi:unnamed protein product [Rotaria socialis]|uniref:Inositolphosphotransferase Aur1/Ipt1 domain-containing protein n=1 Tax=Rotaria socialis TaxID=392032 RepID=A0A817U680_9BILA|nr:unnamed protein product [Rotaria socialis]CAF3327710.1 unnamed protein product [Rotaria socialis]CAF3379987.1 unnamed protein product [Rotaria socialis]CAF3726619.1 unnamed protein product [Rotaria socialis]
MRFYNPLYTRKWSKILAPFSTFITQLGKQLGLQSILGKNSNDDSSINMDSLSNEHLLPSHHDNDSTPSMNILSTFFSTFTSPSRSRTRSKSSYGKPPHNSNTKVFKYYKKQRNGDAKYHETNTIYHQLNIHPTNDENNNQTKREVNQNSVTIDLFPSSPSQSKESLVGDDDLNKTKYILTAEHFIWIFILTIFYFTWFMFIAGISIIPIIIYLVLMTLYLLSDRTRRFALAIIIYFTYLFLYDALHLIPNYTVSQVHIRDVYSIEKKLFGVFHNGHLMTLNEYFKLHHVPLLDIFSGLCYLSWIPIPIAYSLYLYRYRNKRDYIDFALTFLLTNILGFVIYYIVPAAPPWYIELYGFDMNMKVPGSPAGFIQFDKLTGIKVFSSMYSKNANVFAAIPSLHAAYPLITVLYGSLSKRLWVHIGFVLFTLSVWFSAVYSRHHYVLDVLAGGSCAIVAYILYRLVSRIPTINRLLVAYSKLI